MMIHTTFRRAAFLWMTGLAMVVAAKVPEPALDVGRIVNESYGFLKDREPQMTESEYVLYEKVVPLAQDNPELVLGMLEAMVSGAEPASPAFSFVLGNVYYAQEKFAPAEGHYRSAVERHPEFQRAWSNLGLLYYGMRRYEDAIQCLSRAVELGDRDGRILSTLAYCHHQSGNSLSAELVYMQAVTVNPSDINSIAALAGVLIDNQEYIRAEPLVRRLLRMRPGDKSHWTLYASLLESAGRRVEACATLELASTLGLADGNLLLTLGDMYALDGNFADAELTYRKLDTLAPGEGTFRLLSRVRAMAAEGRLQEAEAALARVSVPSDIEHRGEYLRTLASVRAGQANWLGTRQALEELLTLKPFDGNALLALGRAAVSAGDLSRAELAFTDAAKQPDFAYTANLELANLALRSRHYQRSAGHLEAALAIERSPGLVRHLAQLKTYLSDHE